MKKLYIIVFCILLISCSENNIASEKSNINNHVNNHQVADEMNDKEVIHEEENTSEHATTDSSMDGNEVDTFANFMVVVRVDELNVRSEPSVDSEKLSTVALNTDHIVYDEYVNNETGEYWYKIQLEDGSMGWIAGWFVTRGRGGAMALYSDMSLESDLLPI